MTQLVDVLGEYREKRPASVADFSLNWVDLLSGDTIVTSAWVVPTGIAEEVSPAASKTNTTTTIWLSGGTEGQEYVLENTITTVGGRTFVRPLRIKVVAVLRPVPQVSASQQLQELQHVVNTGAKEIETRPGGYRRIVYRNKEEIDQIKAELGTEISGSPASSGTSRCTLASHRRG